MNNRLNSQSTRHTEHEQNVDLERRKTLKLAGVAGAASLAGLAGVSGAVNAMASPETMLTGASTASDAGPAELNVEVQHSWAANDIQLVFTNRGKAATTLTQITPANIQVARGRFDIAALLKNGPVTLQAGESVTVELSHESRHVNPAAALGHFDLSLQKKLRSSLSVVTDNEAYAVVNIPNSPRLV